MADIYKTTTMLAAIKKTFPVQQFFKQRYFDTLNRNIYPTTEVLIEYQKGGRKMAPFVIPEIGGVILERNGYYAERYEPAYIAPERMLTIDALNKKGFGEDLHKDKSPEERQREILGVDLAELSEAIERREEWMCRELFMNGKIEMLHQKDGTGKVFQKKVLCFYQEEFENRYIPMVKWDKEGHSIYDDLDAMVRMLVKTGNPATDLILGANVTTPFIKDKEIQELFNNRRIELGTIKPSVMPDGVGYLGQLVVRGRPLNIFTYDADYEDSSGNIIPFMPSNEIIITAPKMGHFLYGAVTQIEQKDGLYHTYQGTKVPQYISDVNNNTRKLRVASAPVCVPKDANSWVVANVMTE